MEVLDLTCIVSTHPNSIAYTSLNSYTVQDATNIAERKKESSISF